MEQKHIVAMEDLHKKHSDIDEFLGETVSYIKENNISDDDFFAWWEQVDLSNEPTATGEDEKASSFLNDMVRIADDWDFYCVKYAVLNL